MGNTQFHCASQNTVNFITQPVYDVFINHRGIDVKKTIASLLDHNLKNKGCNVFLDKKSIQVGDIIPGSIKHAIRTASVHVAIFSPNYAESEWCLNDLHLMLKTGAPIIPVFCEIQPSELRMEDEDGVYARAFQMHHHNGKISPQTLEKWKKALREVSHIKGSFYKGDQGDRLEHIANCVTKSLYAVKSYQDLNLTDDPAWYIYLL